MRTGMFHAPVGMSIERIREELDFWGFDMEVDLTDFKPTKVHLPVGQSLRILTDHNSEFLLEVTWSCLLRTPLLWETAKKGFRRVAIFWALSSFSSTLDSGILVDHWDRLKILATEQQLQIEYHGILEWSDVPKMVRSHDMVTQGFINASEVGRVLMHEEVAMEIKRGTTLTTFRALRPHQKSFVHGNYIVHLYLENESCSWKLNKIQEEGPPARSLFTISVVCGNTLYPITTFPKTSAFQQIMSSDIVLQQSYAIPEDASNWYVNRDRHYARTNEVKDNDKCVLFIEEFCNASLLCREITTAHQFRDGRFDHFVVQW